MFLLFVFRSLQKQQTQYKQQIKNLERELKRLKENDPLQSCELNIEDLQYSEEGWCSKLQTSTILENISTAAVKRFDEHSI